MRSMHTYLPTCLALAMAAAALSARDTADDRRPARRVTDPDRRMRLQEYLAAFRRLSPSAQAGARQLDADLRDEDAETRARLMGVMERYALWLSRLSADDRRRVEEVGAGPDRLRVVRAIVDQQWLDNLPPSRKEMLAKATDAERASLIARWHKDEQDRQQDRAWALRAVQERMIPGQVERRKQFLEAVERFAKNELEPRLNDKEKKRLQAASSRGAGSFAFLHQVWILSSNHKLTPPGPPDVWVPFRDPRR